jgi:hypothetical protein
MITKDIGSGYTLYLAPENKVSEVWREDKLAFQTTYSPAHEALTNEQRIAAVVARLGLRNPGTSSRV